MYSPTAIAIINAFFCFAGDMNPSPFGRHFQNQVWKIKRKIVYNMVAHTQDRATLESDPSGDVRPMK